MFDVGSAISGIAGAYASAKAADRTTKRQIEWERERAKNAHQWEVQDLKAAGLNPILSAGGQGAATGSISAVMPDFSGISDIGANMTAAKKAETERKAQKSQEKLNDATVLKTQADANSAVKTTELLEEQKKLAQLELKQKAAEFKASKPMLETEANYRNSKIGKGLSYIGLGTKDLAPALNALSLGIGGFAVKGAIRGATSALKGKQAVNAINKLPPKGKLITGEGHIKKGLSAREKWEMIPAKYWQAK